MIDLYRLMHRFAPQKYTCLMEAEAISDCYAARDKLGASWSDIVIWGPKEYAQAVAVGFVSMDGFGTGLYGN